MRRDITSWYSPNLNMEMPLVAYGHAGYPLLMFPTAAADYLEYERFYLIDSIKYFLENGLIRAYSINSVNKYSLLNRESHPGWKVEMLTRYDRYIMQEVLPLMRNECGEEAKPLTTGASLGAFLAANTYFKHSDSFRGTIAMSGSFDKRVLNNIPRIYPAAQARMQAKGDHPLEALLVKQKQLPPGRTISRRRAREQRLGIGRFGHPASSSST